MMNRDELKNQLGDLFVNARKAPILDQLRKEAEKEGLLPADFIEKILGQQPASNGHDVDDKALLLDRCRFIYNSGFPFQRMKSPSQSMSFCQKGPNYGRRKSLTEPQITLWNAIQKEFFIWMAEQKQPRPW